MSEHAPAIPNARLREEWNNATGRRWLERHEAVDRQIAPFGRHAMDRANIQPGQRILDVGCGCGETTVELASRIGPSGFAMGVDISHLLLGRARELAKESGLANLQFEQGDAQTFPFAPASFDAAFSRFGIMFFDEPEAAFGNLHSALRPGRLLTFMCWPAPRDNQFMTIPLVAAGRHMTLPEPGDPNAPGPFAFADIERVRRVLSRAGFAEIEIDRLVEKVGGGTLDETAGMLMQLGPLSSVLDGIDEATRSAILTDIRAALADFELSGRVLLDAKARLVIARRH